MRVLVTGGCGYIGSHTCVRLIETGHEPIVVDNLSNSKDLSLERVSALSGMKPVFYKGDVRDSTFLEYVFSREKIEAVIHFAGLKSVGESVSQPLVYFDNNLTGTLNLLNVMSKVGVKKIVFSSSATVYGNPSAVPVTEEFSTSALNPYGQTKLSAELMLSALSAADKNWSTIVLRYFNPVGAHPSGEMGEDPQGVPNNLVPYIAQVASGRLPYLKVYGDDYPTLDGTGVRDYIHVMDLAEGHIAALDYANTNPGYHVFNLGTGHGISVLQMIAAFNKVCGHPLPYRIMDRRSGDAAEVWSDPAKAALGLGWKAKLGLADMVGDVWRWQLKNPRGYAN